MTSRIFCWGGNQNGQLGIGNLEEDNVTEPKVIKDALTDVSVSQIACGDKHTLFVLSNGALYSCGNNDYGNLGHTKRTSRPEKIDALESQTVVQARAGMSHSLCLTTAGEVFSWGDNTYGQLGRGAPDSDLCRIPKLIKFPHTVVQISCGGNHNLLLTDDGHLFSWGNNDCGQLGLGNTSNQSQPTQINSLPGVPIGQLACGGSHSFVLTKSGTVFSWGRNSYGQLGTSDNKDRQFPVLCKSLRTQQIMYITCGEDHTAALTRQGGLFMFGAGTYGQLGHGNKTHEVLPRKVLELMGSQVTQVACGRRHTVAYVQSSGRLYVFGSGTNGQLGSKDSGVQPLPVQVSGPFVPYNRQDSSTKMDTASNSPSTEIIGPTFVIHMVAAGGDQTFLFTISPDKRQVPVDYRMLDDRFQVKCLTESMAKRIGELKPTDKPPIEFEEDVLKIFASMACWNSSFLDEEGHFGSSKTNHGVDMPMVRKCFEDLGNTTHSGFVQKILHSLKSGLFPSLPRAPPDVEALRVYLLLPFFHLFEQPKYFRELINPLGAAILDLDKVPASVIDMWWGNLSPPFFQHTVSVFKEAVIHILQLPNPQGNHSEMEARFKAMYLSLEVLKKLNTVNENNNQIVPYKKFYVPIISEKVSLKEDYVQWFTEQIQPQGGPKKLLFCNYPFTFDASAKSLLLETDGLIQKQTAVQEVQRRNFSALFLPIDPANPFLVFVVSREDIVKETIHQLMNRGSADLKKPLKVVFKGEESTIDAGGVRKEFFLLLLRELLDPKYGMFKVFEESCMQWFAPYAFEEHQMYMLIGVLCGLAIYNSVIIQLSFPLALYKKLLNRHPNLEDIQELMPTVGKGMETLLNHEDDDIEEIFCLTFEVSQEYFGEVKTVELIPGGKDMHVTKENRKEYVEKYVGYLFNESVKQQFDSFSTGFHKVCGGQVLDLFHPQELRAMVVGNENYDFHELEKNTEYKEEFHRYHPTIQYFWDVFHDLSIDDKKRFLLYLTGCDKVPIQGMKYVKLIIQPMKVPETYLPVAHTCFNLLDLPLYSSKQNLRTKLHQAIEQTQGFGLV